MANEDLVASKTEIINTLLVNSGVPTTLLPKNKVLISRSSDIILLATLGFDDSYGDFTYVLLS